MKTSWVRLNMFAQRLCDLRLNTQPFTPTSLIKLSTKTSVSKHMQ